MMMRWQRSIQIHYSTSSWSSSTSSPSSATSSVSSSSWLTTVIQRVLLSVAALGNVPNATNQINTTIPHTGHINVVVCCHNQEDTDIPYFVPRGWTDGPTANHGNRIYRSRTNGSTENVSPMKMSNDLLPVVIKFLYWPSKCLLGNVAFRTRQPSPLLPVTHLVYYWS